MSLVLDLFTTINTQVDQFTFDTYHAIVNLFSTTLTMLLIIYFATLGWLVVRGLVPLTPLAIAWHMLIAAFIFTFALRWEYFSYFFVNFFMHGADKLVAATLTSTEQPTDKFIVIRGLSDIWEKGSNVFVNLLRTSGSDFLPGIFMGFLGCAIVTGIVAMALFYILMSKIALSVLLALAPVILPMFLWESTRGIFNSWLQLLARWMITPLLLYAFIGLYFKLIQSQIDIMEKAVDGPTTASILGFTLLGVIIMATFKQAGNMSRDIAQKIAIGNIGSQTVPGMALKAWQQNRGHK